MNKGKIKRKLGELKEINDDPNKLLFVEMDDFIEFLEALLED